MKIKTKEIKSYNCSLCGKSDSKTFKEAREGKLVTICKGCDKPILEGEARIEEEKRHSVCS